MKRIIALAVLLAITVFSFSSCASIANLLKKFVDKYGTDTEIATQQSPSSDSESGTAAHVHDVVSVPGTPPTCTEDGLTDGEKCSVCGEVLVPQDVIPALGHDPVENPETYLHPTWNNDGRTEDTFCSRCGQLYNEGAKIPFNYERIVEVFFENVLHLGTDLPKTDMSELTGEEVYDLTFALAPYYGFSFDPYFTGADELGINSYEIPKDFFNQMTSAMFGCTYDDIPNYYPLAGTLAYFDFQGGFGGFDRAYVTVHYKLIMGMARIKINFIETETGNLLEQYMMIAETNGDKLLIRSVELFGQD